VGLTLVHYLSTLNISGTANLTFETFIRDSSTLNISGGNVPWIEFEFSSSGIISGGQVGFISLIDSTSLQIVGGQTGWLSPAGSGIVDVFGGDINVLDAFHSSVVNIYGNGFAYDPFAGGSFRPGLLTGFYLDSTPFSIEMDNASFSHVNLIPEPAGLWLLALGSVVLIGRRPDHRRMGGAPQRRHRSLDRPPARAHYALPSARWRVVGHASASVIWLSPWTPTSGWCGRSWGTHRFRAGPVRRSIFQPTGKNRRT